MILRAWLMQSSRRGASLAAAIAATSLVACGDSQDRDGTSASAAVEGGNTAGGQTPVPMTTEPDDPCGWIPVSEVEAVVGKLAAPPKRKNGCRYTLVIPEAVRAKRQQYLDNMEKFRERFKGPDVIEFDGPMANYQKDPSTYAVDLTVDVTGELAGEKGVEAARKIMRAESGKQGGGADGTAKPPMPEGWDAPGLAPYGFSGRVGHIRISVRGVAPDVPREVSQALAARVRDRIPDLPFTATNPYQILARNKGDPCDLLTRAEAEAVLGPLVVEPYRSSSYFPPLAHPEGHGCSWYTAGHRVFSLVPVWNDGQVEFKMNQGMGALMEPVLPQELTIIKGPWDEAHVGLTGALLFLKGEQLLEVHYLTSSTDMRGAVKLAAQAMPRM